MLLNLKKKGVRCLQVIDEEVLLDIRRSFRRQEFEALRKKILLKWCLACGLITVVLTPFIVKYILHFKADFPDVFSSGFLAGVSGSLLFVLLLGGLVLYQRTLSSELRDLEGEYE